MNILVGCEESQTVTKEFRKLGYTAYSCDMKPCTGGHPEWHYQEDILEVIKAEHWDMLIAFPPCTHLSKAGSIWWKQKFEDGRQLDAIHFVKQIWASGIHKTVIENPVGILSNTWMRPHQVINPYEYGHPYTKPTCLWIRGLPKLKPTKRVIPGKSWTNEHRSPTMRSKTFEGIAKAMATQWTGNYYQQLQLL